MIGILWRNSLPHFGIRGELQYKRWKLKQREEMTFEERESEGYENELLIISDYEIISENL